MVLFEIFVALGSESAISMFFDVFGISSVTICINNSDQNQNWVGLDLEFEFS